MADYKSALRPVMLRNTLKQATGFQWTHVPKSGFLGRIREHCYCEVCVNKSDTSLLKKPNKDEVVRKLKEADIEYTIEPISGSKTITRIVVLAPNILSYRDSVQTKTSQMSAQPSQTHDDATASLAGLEVQEVQDSVQNTDSPPTQEASPSADSNSLNRLLGGTLTWIFIEQEKSFCLHPRHQRDKHSITQALKEHGVKYRVTDDGALVVPVIGENVRFFASMMPEYQEVGVTAQGSSQPTANITRASLESSHSAKPTPSPTQAR